MGKSAWRFQQCAGYCLMVATVVAFVYYTFWMLLLPFFDNDQPVWNFFPSHFYGLAIPAALLFLVSIITSDAQEMSLNLTRTTVRRVRTLSAMHRKSPWPMFFKSKGWRENGPYYDERWEWPDRDSGWSVLPTTENAPNQTPVEIVAPDLRNFNLKPYVSYRMPEEELKTRQFTPSDLYELACKSTE